MQNQEAALAAAVQDVVTAYQDHGSVLWTGDAARQLHLEYPQCGIATEQIADTIAHEAVRAGVAIRLPWAGDFTDDANQGDD